MLRTPQGKLRDAVPEICKRPAIRSGSPLPLGTREEGGGVNFAVFSRHATRVQLELFDHAGDATPSRVVDLDSAHIRTGDVWPVCNPQTRQRSRARRAAFSKPARKTERIKP